MRSGVPLAVAGAAPLARLDEHGYVHFDDGSRVEWWVLGDDYWHVPRASASLRQHAIDLTPVRETAIRVPGGDVVTRVAAAVTGDGPVIAFECENRGAIPVAVGLAHVDAHDHVDLAVHPVTHGTTWRTTIGRDAPPDTPDVASVVRGWLALARQGTQVTTNDPAIDDALLAARCDALVRQGEFKALGKRAPRDDAAAVADALTLLGYDDEAGALRAQARLKPRRRGLPLVGGDSEVALIRNRIARDDGDGIDVLPGFTDEWRGRSVDVTGLPTNHGVVSFALRWHGDNPALLWEVADAKPVRLTASALAPSWSSNALTGEELLTR